MNLIVVYVMIAVVLLFIVSVPLIALAYLSQIAKALHDLKFSMQTMANMAHRISYLHEDIVFTNRQTRNAIEEINKTLNKLFGKDGSHGL
jgi:type II secretory pathway component PulJ